MTTQPFQVGDQVRWVGGTPTAVSGDNINALTVKYAGDDLLVLEENGHDRPVWRVSWKMLRKVVELPTFYAVVGTREYHHVGDRVFTSLPMTLDQARDYMENTVLLYGIQGAFIAHFRSDGTWGVVDET